MHADDLDRASELQDLANQEALKQARASVPYQVSNLDGTWPSTECAICGEDMDEGRLNLGLVRCIICQEKLESRKKFFR